MNFWWIIPCIRYGLSKIQSDTIKNLFAINETTGELFVLNTLYHGTYQIIVEASDMGTRHYVQEVRHLEQLF
jgi:cobalamin biosynthesis Mg chelatase CobN